MNILYKKQSQSWSRYISVTAVYFLAVAVSLTLFFELWRFIFFLFTRNQAAHVPLSTLIESFLVGIRFDFSIASYITLPLYLIGLLTFLDRPRLKYSRWFNFCLMAAMAGTTFFMSVSDIEFFKFFNSRLNGIAMQWEDTPGIVLPLIWSTFPVVRYLILHLAVLILFLLMMRFIMRRTIIRFGPSPLLTNLLYIPLVLAILFIGARGRVEIKSPLRWGLAYFSEYNYANQLALNPVFTFVRDAFYDASSREEIKEAMAMVEVNDPEKIVCDLINKPLPADSERIHKHNTFTPENEHPPNIIIIIMESFGASHIGVLENKLPYDLSPNFDSLAAKSILFTNIYSAGMHTYTGIFSTLYGYPTLFGKSIMKMVTGQHAFRGLPTILDEQGYKTMFFTTHDPHFDNMNGFLKANGMQEVYSVFDYQYDQVSSVMGVFDHVMFDNAVRIIKENDKTPFFATLLTTSNHGPWHIPEVDFKHIPDSDPKHKELNAFKYSDWALGHFLHEIENDPFFENTYVVITADNGKLQDPVLDLDLSYFKIPLLIYSVGKPLPGGKRLGELGSQIDILATVMGLVKLNYDDYSFGQNLLDTANINHHFAQFSEWYKIGYIENDYYMIDRLRGPESFFHLPDLKHNLTDSLGDLAEQYRERALAIFKAAYTNTLKPLPDKPEK